MAIAIKTIPVLKDEAAANFVAKVKKASAKKSSIDFSKQTSIAAKILEKAKL